MEARAKRAGGSDAKRELHAPPLPEYGAHVVLWFNELHRRRQSGPHGPQPLDWPAIESWARQTGRDPTPWELRVLTLLDDCYFAATFGESTPATTEAPRIERAWPAPKLVSA